ncbi:MULTISPECIES: histidine phosphatase family protein [unclassified Streptomyces]|uniref:histidine phosphatase family protein n=1 Tax=unclassified Streptomyces TaxID=2593676 RepID=UPI0038230586
MTNWLIAVRHGESTANAAFARGVSPEGVRDADVGLTDRGRDQAARLAGELLALGDGTPGTVLCSPYRRARQTLDVLDAVHRAAGHPLPPASYEPRLRDRGTGALELLTPQAVRERFPQEAARRAREGEQAYRPPGGGESMDDVALRVRSVLDGLPAGGDGAPVLLVAHDAVVLMIRHLLGPPLPEEGAYVANGSFARWGHGAGGWRLADWNRTPPAVR